MIAWGSTLMGGLADPPDTVKARLQVQESSGRLKSLSYNGTVDAFFKVRAAWILLDQRHPGEIISTIHVCRLVRGRAFAAFIEDLGLCWSLWSLPICATFRTSFVGLMSGVK